MKRMERRKRTGSGFSKRRRYDHTRYRLGARQIGIARLYGVLITYAKLKRVVVGIDAALHGRIRSARKGRRM